MRLIEPSKTPQSLTWIKEIQQTMPFNYIWELRDIVMNTHSWALGFSLTILIISAPAIATNDAQGARHLMMAPSESQDIHALREEIRALRAEIAQLRKSVTLLQALKPTLTSFMPDFAERFHVMHRAGDAGDWAVAAHEVLEMQRLLGIAKKIDPEKGALMEGYMSENLRRLDEAIEHGKLEPFYKAMNDTVKNCNACHVAVGSPFIKVSLDVDESLSMRHPHALDKSKVPVKHTHTH